MIGGIKSTFTVLFLLALFHSIFHCCFHSTFGTVSQYFFIAVSQYFWCSFTIFVIAVSDNYWHCFQLYSGRVTVQLYFFYSRPFSSVLLFYSSRFQLYSQPSYCTALFLAMLLFGIIQVLFPTVLPYSFIPGHLFAVHGLFIVVKNSNLFAVCRLFIAVKTIIICLLLFGSAQ